MRWSELPPRHNLSYPAWGLSLFLLALPTIVMALLAQRTHSVEIAVGAGVQGLFMLVFLRVHPVWRPPVSVSVVVLYLIALAWSWVPLRASTDWVPHLVHGLLLFVAVMLLAMHDLTRTGAEPLRRANAWVQRIKARRHWPPQLADCRVLPEAIGLRNATVNEPGPALALLADPRPEVQTTALGALEHRPHWRPGEAEYVLKFGRASAEPAVRAAAAYALAGVCEPELVAGLAGFLRDPAPEVRMAAAESLMWEADARWAYARDGVREAMADHKLVEDGAMFLGMGRLPAAAVADMISWSAEHPPLAHRAILTLIEHYHADLSAGERPELASELAAMMLEADTSPALRVELAALLRDHHLLSPDLLDRLTNLDQPGPMRLFAAELMLRINPHDPDGIDVLRGLARQPNRELAVHVAAVLQNVLGLNVGLAEGELPAPNSKQASDLARRVLAWANGANPDILVNPTPGPRGGLSSASRASMASYGSQANINAVPPGGSFASIPSLPSLNVEPMDESAMIPKDEPAPAAAPAPRVEPVRGTVSEPVRSTRTEPAMDPLDASGMLPRETEIMPREPEMITREPEIMPRESESILGDLGVEDEGPDTVPVAPPPKPPPIPRRIPRPGSSGVI
jgi:hypothetical protein